MKLPDTTPSPYRISFRLALRTLPIATLLLTTVVPAQTRQIHADAAKPLGPHTQVPLLSIGAGHAADGLRPDWQAQLATLQSEIGFHYLRFHGILDDDMGLYTETPTGTPVYNFQKLDTLYDALLARHIRPFVELSFMPSALASGTRTLFAYNANVTPPKDPARWQALIRALVQHCIARYGQEEVESWYFEVWNEPDSPTFFAGSMDDYQSLYRSTALALKEVCPKCRIGGPAILTPFVAPFLNFLATTHTPADFLSLHAYAVTHVAADGQGRPGAPLDPSPLAIVRTIRAARLVTDRSALPQLPVHLTEWSASYFSDDPLHDQYGAASFLLSRIRASAPYAASLAYWTFTDILSEHGDQPPGAPPFTGGFGLLTRSGIRKPTFYAYRFLAALGPTDLTIEDTTDPTQSWITATPTPKGTSIQALFWDYTPQSPPSGQIDQTFYKQEIPALPIAPVDLTVDHLPNGAYTMTVSRIGHTHHDPYTAWLQGTTTTNEPATAHILTIKNHQFHQMFPMVQNDVYLVTLTLKPHPLPNLRPR